MLKKHEQENVLVKSEQKRKITTLQDNINRLRHKVGQSHKTIAKEEAALHASIANIGKQMKKLEELKKVCAMSKNFFVFRKIVFVSSL